MSVGLVGLIGHVQCLMQFDITNVGTWTLDLKTGSGSVVKGDGKGKPDLVIKVGEADFAQLYDGKLNAQQVRRKANMSLPGPAHPARWVSVLMWFAYLVSCS